MNAKKIMGAVLVALLAAALFTGAAAANPLNVNGNTVFFYEAITNPDYGGTWTNAAGDYISLVPGKQGSNTVSYFDGTNAVEGVYTQGDASITVKFPTATIVGLATTDNGSGITYNVIGQTFYNDGKTQLSVSAESPVKNVPATGYLVTAPNGVTTKGAFSGNVPANLVAGTYEVRAAFDGSNKFVDGTPDNLLTGKDVFTFKVKNSADPEITAVADSVVVGDTLKVTIAGVPGTQYTLKVDGFVIPVQAGLSNTADVTTIIFNMPNNGQKTVTLEAVKDGEGSAVIGNDDASVDIEILEGEITAESEKESYYIGQKVVLSGTSSGSKTLYFYIEGTNVKTTQIKTATGNANYAVTVEADKTWEAEITYDMLKKSVAPQDFDKLDAGTYTIYVSGADPQNVGLDSDFAVDDVKDLKPYTTVSVPLKQLFLTAELQTTVVAQGSDLVVTGTAEAAGTIMYYIFGNNFYKNDTAPVKKDSTYKIKETIPTSMAAGQYFVVVQHPMYDKDFNIGPSMDYPATIILNTTGDVTKTKATVENTLFKANSRQTANAAEALCQALDTQNIDDIYVKATFIVAAPTATMNPIPSEVAKGTKLTVSGTTNMAPGEIITVEMLSTAFAAVPKEDVNAASFIALTTKVQDDGTWEVTFDTTGLNLDEYTITATAGQFVSTAKVNVVEKAPVTPEQPDTPVTPEQPTDKPEQPTEPETPGFGALAALAGLGAVAVLLLRRE